MGYLNAQGSTLNLWA